MVRPFSLLSSVNDIVLKVNGLDVAGMDKRALYESVHDSKGSLTLVSSGVIPDFWAFRIVS